MPIKQVRSAKFLGVYLDEHLTWSDHVETIIGKISKTCGTLNKLKYCLPQSILLNIYNTLILLYLQYCAIVWANYKQQILIQKILEVLSLLRPIVHDTSKTAKITWFILVLHWAMDVIYDFYYIHGPMESRINQVIFAVLDVS